MRICSARPAICARSRRCWRSYLNMRDVLKYERLLLTARRSTSYRADLWALKRRRRRMVKGRVDGELRQHDERADAAR